MNLTLGDLILLLILLAPVLSRLFRKKPGPGPSPMPPDGRTAPEAGSEESPLAEALRQIREALEEPEPEPAAPTAPPKPLADRPRPLPPRPASRPVPARPARENGFHGLGAFEHDEHGFGRSNPLSEEIFEQRGPRAPKGASTKPIGQKPLKEVDLSTPLEVKKVGPSAHTDYARLLQDERRVREAFVLKEVLDPPRSLKRRS